MILMAALSPTWRNWNVKLLPPGTTSSAGADPEATVPALSNEMLRNALRNIAALGMEN